MRIDCYHFFFHPCHKSHSETVKAFAVITTIALTILTSGLYLALFIGVRCSERSAWTKRQVTHNSHGGYVGNEALKAKLSSHLEKLKARVVAGDWQSLQTHTDHEDSAFDWWMFPSDRSSHGQGDLYKLSAADIAALKKDDSFMQKYREGVRLVALSWGWDLKNEQDVTNENQRWADWTIRLAKMLYSLKLFGETQLHAQILAFAQSHKIQVSSWAL